METIAAIHHHTPIHHRIPAKGKEAAEARTAGTAAEAGSVGTVAANYQRSLLEAFASRSYTNYGGHSQLHCHVCRPNFYSCPAGKLTIRSPQQYALKLLQWETEKLNSPDTLQFQGIIEEQESLFRSGDSVKENDVVMGLTNRIGENPGPGGITTREDAPFTDSGYASIPNVIQSTGNLIALEDKEKDDTKTIYSAATTVNPVHSHQYISELCSDIHNRLGPFISAKSWCVLARALPRLVKAFAITIGHDSSTQAHRDIMYFIHKRHGWVAHIGTRCWLI